MLGTRSLLLGLLATTLAAAPASAQRAGNLDLNAFRPAMDSRGYLTVNASEVLSHNDLSFGIGALDWGYKMLSFSGGNGATYEVENIVSATFVAAYGLAFGPVELELGASLPVVLMSGDREPDDRVSPTDVRRFKLDGQGLGNLGLHLKTRFLKSNRGPKIGLGVIASVYLPTVTTKDRFLGESKAVPQVIGILDKPLGRTGRLRVALNGGVRLRPSTSFTDSGADGAMPTGQTITAGTEIPFGVGAAYGIRPRRLDLVGEVFGAIPLDGENYFPLEAIAGLKVYLARNSYFTIGAGRGLAPSEGANPDFRAFIGMVFEPNDGDRDGDGIKDTVDKCPDAAEDEDGFQDDDGCPDPDNDRDGILDEDDACRDTPEDKDGVEDEDGCPDPDNDQDGILDIDDVCPDDPEDKDGFQDEDGCPDPDNDKDRILDQNDKCPDKPETYNNVDDEDGCPDRGRVEVGETEISTLDMVYFEYNKAVIKKESYSILNDVAVTLNGNPEILLVEIQGHTDERGDDAYNLDLSDRRAKAVQAYLVGKGVEEKRLTAQGYGETQPLIRESNERAYAKNRRVAFLIIKRAAK